MRILTVIGTRPEAIKMAPVIKELQRFPERLNVKVCISAQHREMLDPLLGYFGISPDFDLNIMKEDQGLADITASILKGMEKVFKQYKPDYVLVQGDTTTSMAAALAAYYHQIPIGHIEAGLRTFDKYQPFPEEINRRIIDQMSDLYFVPTLQAQGHLLKEGVDPKRILLTGNTVIDTLLTLSANPNVAIDPVLTEIPLEGKKLILVTAHRRENLGDPLENICQAIQTLANKYLNDVVIVYPYHLNPRVKLTVQGLLQGLTNVFCIPPLDYPSFVYMMKKAYLILTDSGGIQEEAPSLHKPVLVLRETTERPEALEVGATRLVGTGTAAIVSAVSDLIDNPEIYRKMSQAGNPYGDGLSSQRIVARLLEENE